MSSNNSEQDFDEVNNSDHSTEREGTAGQNGNSSTRFSHEGENISRAWRCRALALYPSFAKSTSLAKRLF